MQARPKLCEIVDYLHLNPIDNLINIVCMDFCGLKQAKHRPFLIFLSIIMIDCTPKKDAPTWSNAMLDTNISKVPVYAQLDKQKELFSAFETKDSLLMKTSDVEYSSGKTMRVGEFNNLKINNCRAYFNQSDALFIDIGIGTGFGAQGFRIMYKDKKFYTEPYFATDVIVPGETDPTYKVIYQKLTLDKPAYKLGDSLYGYINFKSIETGKNNSKSEHWGKGYFRAIITRL